jgi:hypothetical protein
VHHYSLYPQPAHTPQPVGRLTVRSENGIFVQLQSMPGAASA